MRQAFTREASDDQDHFLAFKRIASATKASAHLLSNRRTSVCTCSAMLFSTSILFVKGHFSAAWASTKFALVPSAATCTVLRPAKRPPLRCPIACLHLLHGAFSGIEPFCLLSADASAFSTLVFLVSKVAPLWP